MATSQTVTELDINILSNDTFNELSSKNTNGIYLITDAPLIVNTNTYGTTLPTSGAAGQVFFLIV